MLVPPSDDTQVGPVPQVQAHRMNLYLTPSVYAEVQSIVEARGFRSPTDLIQQALRITLLAYKHEADPNQGLYWKNGEIFSRVTMV